MMSVDDWNRSVLEYFVVTELPSGDQTLLLQTHRVADVIKHAIESRLRKGGNITHSTVEEDVFIAALASAGIHMEAVSSTPEHDKMHTAIIDHLAVLLLYADAVGNSRESSYTFAQTAFV